MKSDVADFMESAGDEVEVTETGKIRFLISGMEFPATASVEVLKAHFNGRAMRRARVQRANEQYDFAAHLPHIVPHKFMNEEKFLFCYLTSKTLPRNAEVVERHVNGKKYKRKLKESLEKKAELDRIKEKRKAKAEKAKEFRRKHKEVLKNGKVAAGNDGRNLGANGTAADDAEDSADDEVFRPEDSDADMKEAEVEGEGAANGDAFANAVKNGFAGEAESLLTDTLAAGLADSDAESKEDGENDEGEEEGDVEEEEDNFWTRGKKRAQKPPKKVAENADAMEDGDSDDDEWKTKKKPKAKGKRALARASAAAASAGSKRKRAPMIPKKVRQARRRRNSGGAPPGAAIAAGN